MALLERLMPKVGDVLRDRYELLDVLGEGGFGVVFRARQRGLDSDVAVKVLLPHLLAHDSLVRRFEREVTVVKTLRHPNTIRVLDVGQTEKEVPYYVMEFVTGRALEDVLGAGPLSPERTRRIALQVLKSLAEAHERGVVHRDLKPANIMLCEFFGESDFVKVLDFGIAKAIEDDKAGFVTQTGAILGTPTYLSPEQARGDRDLDPRSDLYTVGLIIAECLSGEPIVTGGSTYEVVATHAEPSPLNLPKVLRHSPFYEIVTRATDKNRDLRYQTAMQMAEAIADLTDLSDDPIFEVVTTGSRSRRTPPRTGNDLASGPTTPDLTSVDPLLEIEEPRRSRALMWLFAAAVFGVAAALAFSLTQGGARTDSSAVATGGAETASSTGPESPVPPVSEAAPATREEVAMAAEDPTPPPEMPQPASDPARLREAVASATQGLAASLPATHRVHLDGTEGARVLLGERELGRLPLDLELPRLSATVELRFERRGFQPRTVAVSLDQEAVRVDLERRRAQPATETPTEAPSETPVRLPFEEAPIYD